MRRFVTILALALITACAPAEQQPASEAPEAAAVSVEGLPAGAYTLDKSHASLTFTVSHLGFSNYTAQFDTLDARMQLDPANPSAAELTATVDVRSLELPSPPPGFREELLGPQWLDAARFPEITFRSTGVTQTGPNTADIAGELTLHGVTRPVTLQATFNGGYPGHPMDPNARLGFSARGTIKRSEFGVSIGVPAPGTTMGVGDDVTIAIETEFSGPAWTPPAQ